LEEFDGLYDPYSGITNNLSESYNAVLKQENDWKELPVDMLVLGNRHRTIQEFLLRITSKHYLKLIKIHFQIIRGATNLL
jgi:hypothetical protein